MELALAYSVVAPAGKNPCCYWGSSVSLASQPLIYLGGITVLHCEKRGLRPSDNGHNFGYPDALPVKKLYTHSQFYLNTMCYSQSRKTIAGKASVFDLLLHYCQWKGIDTCDRVTIAEFLAHAKNGHLEPEGRWGKGDASKRFYEPARPRTIQLYYIYLKHFFKVMVEEGILDRSPMERMPRPQVPQEELIAPTPLDVSKLLAQAEKGRTPLRDVALIRLAYDTGARLNEMSSIKIGDINLENSTLFIHNGKRNKRRLCHFGPETAKTLLRYMRTLETLQLANDDLLFICFHGRNIGRPLTSHGVYQIIKRHARATGIKNVRLSPHMLRHAYAVERMVGGLPAKVVQSQMGHTTYEQTMKYSRAADHRIAEMSELFNQSSPVENLRKLR